MFSYTHLFGAYEERVVIQNRLTEKRPSLFSVTRACGMSKEVDRRSTVIAHLRFCVIGATA